MSGNEQATVETVDLEEFRRRRRDPEVAIVDVLPAASFAAAHIPGAANLPYTEVDARAAAMFPDPAQPIVVYCAGPT